MVIKAFLVGGLSKHLNEEKGRGNYVDRVEVMGASSRTRCLHFNTMDIWGGIILYWGLEGMTYTS